ncbi:MAG: group I intron-associated PD-(D/E)XK endonuclease [Candidatus Altimarinota bacterium]
MGCISEYAVASDLLQRGFEVFKALSPAASCDLIVMKDGKYFRIEVKTGTKKGDGVYWNAPRAGLSDILGVYILATKEVLYPDKKPWDLVRCRMSLLEDHYIS